MKKYLFLLALATCMLGASEVWKLKNIRGKSAVFDGKTVIQKSNSGEFELYGTKGFPVKKGVEYIFDFECMVKKNNGAYVNFYLRGVDKNGNQRMTVPLGGSPGKRGFNRDRMSRLEVPSDHFLTHRVRFKGNKHIEKVIPVYESSDGEIILVPGKMTMFENLNRPDVVAVISKDVINNASGKLVWSSFKLMPEVEYALESDEAIPAGAYELNFISDAGKVVGKVALNGKYSHFRLPAETVQTTLLRLKKGNAFSAKIRKDFSVDFYRGVYENEWQGTELNKGTAQGKKVYFRKTFNLDKNVAHAAIRFLGHNKAELFVNGVSCGFGSQFAPGTANITKLLKPGENVIGLTCHHASGQLRVIFDLYVQHANGVKQFIVSDNTVKCAPNGAEKNWKMPGFNDSHWKPAVTGGSPKDFGDSIIATRVNNRHERLYIGPVTDVAGAKAKIASKGKLGEKFAVVIDTVYVNLPKSGRLVFRSGDKVYDTLLNGKNNRYTATPRFLPAGKYTAYAAFDRFSFDGKNELLLGEVELAPNHNVILPQFEVKKVNGKSLLSRDGKIIPTAMYCHGQQHSIEVKTVNDAAGIKLHMFWIGNSGGHDGKINLAAADEAVRFALRQIEHDPEAHLLVCASLRPPKNYARKKKYQNELTVTSSGEKLHISGKPGESKFGIPYKKRSDIELTGFSSVSHASQLKVKEYCENVAELINYFENSPYASKIAGYGFSGEMDGQWHMYAPYSGRGTKIGMVDYSPVMLDYFRKYLRKKYQSEAALQKAWKRPDVTFETAVIPGYDERVGEKFFVSKAASDYAEAYAKAEVELIAALSKTAKDTLKRKALIWVYTKDSYRDVGLNQFLPHVLNSGSGFEQYTTPYFDACGNPTDYYFRQNGLHPANRGCHNSAHLNKKIKLLEMDLRSYLTQQHQIFYGGYTAYDTMNHIRNVLMEGFQYGSSYRFYTFWLGWYNNKGILNTMRRMGDIEKAQLTLPIRWKKRVCHFYDDRAITHIGNFDDKGNRIRHYYFAKSLTGVGSSTLNRSGVGFETYYLRDLLNPEFPADQFDVFIFDSCFRFDEKLLKAVNSRLRKPGKVLIFPWGSGFLNEHNEVDPAEVKKLTGMSVAPISIEGSKAQITMKPEAHKLFAAVDKSKKIGSRQRYNVTASLPMLKIVDKNAVVAGRFDDGSAALAVKNIGGADNILLMTPGISIDLLHSICKAANIHIYSTNGYDFVATDGNFMGIHSAAGGVKRVPLPEKVKKAVDFFTGEVVARDTDKLEVMLQDDETKILQFEF